MEEAERRKGRERENIDGFSRKFSFYCRHFPVGLKDGDTYELYRTNTFENIQAHEYINEYKKMDYIINIFNAEIDR